jgi:hypothetical protein
MKTATGGAHAVSGLLAAAYVRAVLSRRARPVLCGYLFARQAPLPCFGGRYTTTSDHSKTRACLIAGTRCWVYTTDHSRADLRERRSAQACALGVRPNQNRQVEKLSIHLRLIQRFARANRPHEPKASPLRLAELGQTLPIGYLSTSRENATHDIGLT